MKAYAQFFALAALTACSNAEEVTAKPTPSDATASAKSETQLAKKMPAQAAGRHAEPDQSAKPKFTSDYSSLSKVKCETIESDETGAGFIREQCGSFKSVPLFRIEGDLRQSAYAGNEPKGETTVGGFNYLTDIVEWRMQDGKPVALIYRLKVDGLDLPDHGKTQLFVQKIGIGDEQSCIIGLVAGNFPKANEKAREIADAAAAIQCSDDLQPERFGDLL